MHSLVFQNAVESESLKRPAISVLISSYNQSATITRTIRSLVDQIRLHGITAEIIIYDDGSSSSHVINILEEAKKYSSDTMIKFVRQPDIAHTLTISRNNGIRIAHGDIFIFLDGDCIPDDGFLLGHINAHKGKNIVVSGDRKYRHLARLSDNTLTPEQTNEENKLSITEERERARIIKAATSNLPWRSVWGRNFSIKNPISSELFFDEKLMGWSHDDCDYAFRLLRNQRIKKVEHHQDISVTQYDESIQSFNPWRNMGERKTADYLANTIYLLLKYQSESDDIFLDFAFAFQSTPQKNGGIINLFKEFSAKYADSNLSGTDPWNNLEPFTREKIFNIIDHLIPALKNYFVSADRGPIHPLMHVLGVFDTPKEPDTSVIVSYANEGLDIAINTVNALSKKSGDYEIILMGHDDSFSFVAEITALDRRAQKTFYLWHSSAAAAFSTNDATLLARGKSIQACHTNALSQVELNHDIT